MEETFEEGLDYRVMRMDKKNYKKEYETLKKEANLENERMLVIFIFALFLGAFATALLSSSFYTSEQIGVSVCNSHNAELLKVEDNADRVLCIKDSRVIVFEDLRGD